MPYEFSALKGIAAGVYYVAGGIIYSSEVLTSENFLTYFTGRFSLESKDEHDKHIEACEKNIRELEECVAGLLELREDWHSLKEEFNASVEKLSQNKNAVRLLLAAAHAHIKEIAKKLHKTHQHERKHFYILSHLNDNVALLEEYNTLLSHAQGGLNRCFRAAVLMLRAILPHLSIKENKDKIGVIEKAILAALDANNISLSHLIQLQLAIELISDALQLEITVTPGSLGDLKLVFAKHLLPVALLTDANKEPISRKLMTRLLNVVPKESYQPFTLLVKKPVVDFAQVKRKGYLYQSIATLLERQQVLLGQVSESLQFQVNSNPATFPYLLSYQLREDGEIGVDAAPRMSIDSKELVLSARLSIFTAPTATQNTRGLLVREAPGLAREMVAYQDRITAVATTRASALINGMMPEPFQASLAELQKTLKLPEQQAKKIEPTVKKLLELIRSYQQQLATQRNWYLAQCKEQQRVVDRQLANMFRHYQTLGRMTVDERYSKLFCDDAFCKDDFVELIFLGINPQLSYGELDEPMVHTAIAKDLSVVTHFLRQGVDIVVPSKADNKFLQGKSLLQFFANRPKQGELQHEVLAHVAISVETMAANEKSLAYLLDELKETKPHIDALKKLIIGYANSLRRSTARGLVYEYGFSYFYPTQAEHTDLLSDYLTSFKQILLATTMLDLDAITAALKNKAAGAKDAVDGIDKNYRLGVNSWAGAIESAAIGLQEALKLLSVREQFEAHFSGKANVNVGRKVK